MFVWNGVTFGIEFISPAEAKKYLDLNTTNYRNLKRSVVERLSKEMANGYWRFNGDPIRFDTDGLLLDGQHRLNAIIQSETRHPFLVVRNLAKEVEYGIDTGSRRTAADVLGHHGLENARSMIAAARLILSMEVPGGEFSNYQHVRFTGAEEAQTVINRYPGLKDSLEYVSSFGTFPKHLPGPTVMGAIHYLLKNRNKVQADDFMQSLIVGEGLRGGNPVLQLRNTLMSMPRLNIPRRRAAVIIKTWNNIRTGRKMPGKLAFKDSRLQREVFPHPV